MVRECFQSRFVQSWLDFASSRQRFPSRLLFHISVITELNRFCIPHQGFPSRFLFHISVAKLTRFCILTSLAKLTHRFHVNSPVFHDHNLEFVPCLLFFLVKTRVPTLDNWFIQYNTIYGNIYYTNAVLQIPSWFSFSAKFRRVHVIPVIGGKLRRIKWK